MKTCFHCGKPSAGKHRTCAPCQRRRSVDYSRVLAGEITTAKWEELWSVPNPPPGVIFGAKNVGGFIFWWKGEPYLSKEGVESIRSLEH